jgi:hypothetical protein
VIQVDAKRTERPFFANRRWLPAERRLETMLEFRRRVQADLDGSIQDLRRNGFPAPRFFAHPRSAGVNDANDPATVAVVNQLVRQRFVASVTNAELPRTVDAEMARRRALPRLEVFRDTSTRALFSRIAATSPRPLTKVRPFRTPQLWVDGTGQPVQSAVPGDRIVLSQQGKAWREAYYAPGRTASWLNYRVSLTVTGLADGFTSAGLTVLAGSEAEHRVTVSARSMSIRVGSAERYRTVRTLPLQPAERHRLTASVLPGEVRISVDDGPALSFLSGRGRSAPRGGVGLYVAQPEAATSLPIFESLLITPLGRGEAGW